MADDLKTFVVLGTYVPNAVERRAPYRDDHLSYARQLHAAGHLLYAGAFADPVDRVMLVYRASSRHQVEAWVAHDPYVRAGLWPSIEIREWSVVIGSLPLETR
jgi:uncharacterized protein YciI